VQAPGVEETPAGPAGAAGLEHGPDGSSAADVPGTAKGQSGTEATAGAVSSAAAAAGQAGNAPLYSMPQADAGWSPSYTAGTQASSVRSNAELNVQAEPKSALVWLGSGLVGVAGAAGLVFFRLRNP
jgi:hypothetical protein